MRARQTSDTKFSIEYKRRRAICTVCSRGTIIRIAPLPAGKITMDWVRSRFPYGEKLNENTHIFSYEAIKSIVFMAALPVETAFEAIRRCEELKIKPIYIKQIDVIERTLFRQYSGGDKSMWVCIPMEDGIRVLTLMDGLPLGAHFISREPGFGKAEAARIPQPEEAVFLEECNWLAAYLSERGISLVKV